MLLSYILRLWRRIKDSLVTVGILAFLVNSSLSGKFFDAIPSENSKSLISKLFERVVLRYFEACSGYIFNVVFGAMYFCRRFPIKTKHCFRWLPGVSIDSPLMFFTELHSWAGNIYILCWYKMTQLLFTFIDSVKSEVIFRIRKANMAMMAFTSTIVKMHRDRHFYYIQPSVMFIATFNVIRTCIELLISLAVLNALTITKFCCGVVFDFIHMPDHTQLRKTSAAGNI
ncbi:unnamed protein product [Larinioides sclopetarius]|uniref:Uncharacterized protein n=1 Tax=Larinioides sclopetarius TaxID=280406 RepID=A0AAV1ZS67_9ARAC